MDTYDELNTIHVANRFIKEISDGWGEETETQDIVRLVELLTPIETAMRKLQAERDALKAENERLRRKLLGASEHLRIHGYGFGEHDSRRYECERISKEWATDALAARDRWQYYYRVDGCTAKESGDVNCICWHDEGTGPCASEKRGESILEWRLAARGE